MAKNDVPSKIVNNNSNENAHNYMRIIISALVGITLTTIMALLIWDNSSLAAMNKPPKILCALSAILLFWIIGLSILALILRKNYLAHLKEEKLLSIILLIIILFITSTSSFITVLYQGKTINNLNILVRQQSAMYECYRENYNNLVSEYGPVKEFVTKNNIISRIPSYSEYEVIIIDTGIFLNGLEDFISNARNMYAKEKYEESLKGFTFSKRVFEEIEKLTVNISDSRIKKYHAETLRYLGLMILQKTKER